MGDIYISRSQARRIMSGLDKFKTVVLDFDRVKTVGQGFADEVFRVWQKHHLNIKIIPKNTNENINFMIKRVLSGM
jgi:aspartokinase